MAHGIKGNAAQWIRNWLAGRRKRVCINQTFSSWTPVTLDVPQGNVLGLLLFLIYINDLDNGIVSKISKFADDTKLCHSSWHPDKVLELQEDLNRLVDWANTWQTNFNIYKCTVMHWDETVTFTKHVSKYKHMQKWMVEFLSKSKNHVIKIAGVNSIRMTQIYKKR